MSGGRPQGAGSPLPREGPGSKPGTAQSQRTNSSGVQTRAAEYVLDFGYVIKGTQKVAVYLRLVRPQELVVPIVHQGTDVLQLQACCVQLSSPAWRSCLF